MSLCSGNTLENTLDLSTGIPKDLFVYEEIKYLLDNDYTLYFCNNLWMVSTLLNPVPVLTPFVLLTK